MFNFPDFNTVKTWFSYGWWNKDLVKLAVIQNKINADQYKEITGEAYDDKKEGQSTKA
ncbi:XkdX family protein [Agrilactobacillus fermenti]|uniref:XkdX family protein n=1 Tax=Agrilactobacillus fermenti TaxID=2586909 RepID=UPI003A5C2CE0